MCIFSTTFVKEPYKLINIKNDNVSIELTNIGASIVSIKLKDKNSKLIDIALGFNNPSGYLNNSCYMGSTVGRNANRIENSTIKIDDIIYNLDKNDGENNLHSGFDSTNNIIWDFELNKEQNSVTFSTLLKDGFQGFPGNFKINVTYTLKDDNSLEITYTGESNKKTIANFTNHTYFNLNGHNDEDILNHKIMINAQKFTPLKENSSVVSGEIKDVCDTPMDFREFKDLSHIDDFSYNQIKYANGYDHNYVVNGYNKEINLVAKAYSPKTHIELSVFSDLPGVQFYTGNFNNIVENTKDNAEYLKRSGFCFETQYFPNSYNIEHFEKPILDKNQLYKTTTIYKFRVRD